MKKIIALSCLLFLCSFAGHAQKFALIDMEYILKNIPAYEMTNEQLSQVSKKWQNEVDAIQQEAQNMYKTYQSDLVFLSEDKGYQMVMDRASSMNIIFASPKIDISNEVLIKLGYSK